MASDVFDDRLTQRVCDIAEGGVSELDVAVAALWEERLLVINNRWVFASIDVDVFVVQVIIFVALTLAFLLLRLAFGNLRIINIVLTLL